MVVEVNVEYCASCGYITKFQELSDYVLNKCPDVKLTGQEGRRGTFEVTINGTLVHSKLTTLAYPDYEDLSKAILVVAEGGEIRKSIKQQPITSCIIV